MLWYFHYGQTVPTTKLGKYPAFNDRQHMMKLPQAKFSGSCACFLWKISVKICFYPYVLNNFISCTIPCTVGNQMLLALWGARSELLKISFWSSLVIPRSQKTITKWISWLSFFYVYWAQNKNPGRKLAHFFGEFPCLTKTSITPARVDGFACLKFVCLPTFRDYHFGPI